MARHYRPIPHDFSSLLHFANDFRPCFLPLLISLITVEETQNYNNDPSHLKSLFPEEANVFYMVLIVILTPDEYFCFFFY